MIIPNEEVKVIIPDTEDFIVPAKPSTSLLNQGSLVINNSTLLEDTKAMEMETLNQKTSEQIRQTASIVNQQKESERFTSLLAQEQDTELVSLALKRLAERKIDNRLALEEEVISAYSDKVKESPVNNFLYENDRGFFENMYQRATKELAITNKLEELKSKSDYADVGLNLLSEVTLVSFLQRATGMGVIDYADELRALQTKLERADASEAMKIIEESEDLIMASQMLGDNPEFVAGELSAALQGSVVGQRTDAILNALDFLDTVFIAKGIAGKSLSILPEGGMSKAAMQLGATDEVADDIVQGANKVVSSTEEAGALSSGLITEFDEAKGLSSKVRKSYAVNQRILNDVLDNFAGMGYDEVQALDVLENIKDRLKAEFSNGSISDVKLKSDGSSDVFILTKGGSPYVSEKSAKAGITRKGFNGEPFQLESGGWAIKANVPTLDAKNANLSTKGVGVLRRYLGRVESWVDDDLLVYAQISENTMNQITKAGQNVYESSLGKLNKKEIDDMLPIVDLQRGRVEDEGLNTWFTPKEIDLQYRTLYDRPATVKEMNAFAGYRLLNDFQYELDNKVLYDKRKAKGYGTVSKDVFGSEINGKFVTDFTENDFIFLDEVGDVLNKNNLPNNFLDNYDVIRVDRIPDLSEANGFAKLKDSPTPYVAVAKGSVEIAPLAPRQLKYLAGGRIRYDADTVFLKQANVGRYPDGKGYRKNDRTLYRATSFNQARKEADSINALNAILREGRDNPELLKKAEDFLQERLILGVDNVKDYLKQVDARGMDINTPVVPLRNRERIIEEGLPNEFIDDVDFMEVSKGRLSARGSETVPHIDPEGEKPLNAIASLNQNFAATANTAAFSAYRDYTLSYLERYRRYLNVRPTDPRINLLDASIRTELKVPYDIIQKIKGEQQFAREVVGRQTAEEIGALQRVENNIEWALGKLPEKLTWVDKNKVSRKLTSELQEDPIGRVRGLVFNVKLGLFSLPAMIIQAIHAPAIVAMSPKHGLKALATYPLVRMAIASQDPAVIKEIAKKVEKLDMKGFGDIETFFKEFRHHGFDNFGANMVYENAARGDNLMRSWGEKFSDKGRMFFEEGELVPRITAYSTSVREWNAKLGGINPNGLPIDSKEARKYIVQRTNTLTLGMTRADLQQGLKSGFLGLVTQFQSYPLRALDAMAFPSKGLTAGERSRLLASYFALYGSAGVPFAGYFADWAVEAFGTEEPDAMYKLMYNGVIDGAIMAATGEDTNFASRGGLGAWANEIVGSFTDDRTTVLEVLLGPAGSTGSGAIDTIIDYAQAYNAGFNPDPSRIVPSVIRDLAKQVSSYNTAERAYIAWTTGKIFDSRGSQFIDMTKTGTILQLFGLPPQAYEDLGLAYLSKDRIKSVKKLYTEQAVKAHLALARELDPAKREEIKEILNGIFSYAAEDGLAQEVNSAVLQQLAGSSAYKRAMAEYKLQRNLGEKGNITELDTK